MSDTKRQLESIFLSALDIESPQERAMFVAESCGDDAVLRAEVEQLLTSNATAGSFLQEPAPELGATVLFSDPNDQRAAAMEAGLAGAFGTDQAVVVGSAGLSVLKSLSMTVDVPQVALRESPHDVSDPILKPKSSEMPQKDSDSRYQLQGEIARGGMGAILKGRDTDLGRDLAIKVLLDAHKDNPSIVQRFIEEAQIGGQLQHPGIAPVYELGQFGDRRPFFSMKLVKGETLSKLLGDRKSPGDERARFVGIFEQICQTMAYAHSRGVIHRDLKPANVMVGAFGEVQVMDWGLAKVLQSGGIADEKKAKDQHQGLSIIRTLRSRAEIGDGSDVPITGHVGSSGSQTMAGSVMGTPAYMPPEQALGEVDLMDERSDVFGLGAILCEVLTGLPPYIGTDGTQVYRMAARGKLTDCFARLDACGADTELIAIAKDCLALEPKDRPRDAGGLAERISAHLASVESRLHAAELSSAAEAARAEEALQTAKEHELAASAERRARKLQMGLAAVVLCVLTIGGIAATWTAAVQSQLKNDALLAEKAASKARQHAEKQQERAEVAQHLAEAEKIRSLNLLADMQTERGLQAGREGQGAKAALWFANAAVLTPHDRNRQEANQRRAQTWSGEAMLPVALLNVGLDARRVEFQTGGSLLMTVDPNGMRVWDWRNELALPWSEQLSSVSDAAISPDGKSMAALLENGEVRLLEPATGRTLRSLHTVDGMSFVEWSPDGARVAVAGRRLQIWNVGLRGAKGDDLSSEPKLESDWAHPAKISGLRFSLSGKRIVSCSEDNLARVFAINEENLPAPLYAPLEHRPVVSRRESAPVFCDDDRGLVTLSSSIQQPVLHDAATGQLLPVDWKLPGLFDRSLEASRDGRWVAVGGSKDAALLSADGKSSLVLTHANHLHMALFAPDGQSLATLGYDGTARLFPLQNLAKSEVGVPTLIPQQNTFAGGAFSPDSHAMAIVANNRIVIWERKPQSPVVGQVRWAEDRWRPRPSFNGQLIAQGIYHEYYDAAGAPARQAELKVARIIDGSAAGPAINLRGLLVDSCICSDNVSVAAVGTDQSTGWLSLFDIATGVAKWKRLELSAPPLSVAARPGRPQVAVLCENGDLLVVDMTRGVVEQTHVYAGVSGPATFARVAYSPDGATLVTVMQNSVVSIRDAESGQLRCKSFNPMTGGGMTRSIAFSPDGRLLATAVTGKNMAQVWSLATGDKVGVDMSHPGDMFGIWSITFSPDGSRLLTGHKDGRVRIFDWRTGEVVGTPLQHPDEVNDIAFSSDGRHLLACVRHGTVHVWDVATGKLAVPLLPQLKPDLRGTSTQSLGVAGHRAVVSANGLYSVLDLSMLLPPIEEDMLSLLRRAELATNQKLQVGELVPLESQEWSTRWEQLVAARQTLEQVAESLAQALDEAVDGTAEGLVIARATRRGLLEKLRALRPKSLSLSVAVAIELSKQGRLDEALKLREQVLMLLRMPNASAAHPDSTTDIKSTAGRGLDIRRAEMPAVLVNDLAQLLTIDAPRGRWLPIEPTEIKGDTETTFSREPNGFLLSSAGRRIPETYSITGRAAVKRIAALRLDVAPHTSLPRGGAGHGGGNFCLTELRARVRHADGTETSLKLASAASDYVRLPDQGTKPTDGPWAVLDGDPGTRWDIFPVAIHPHWLVLNVDVPCELAGDDTLIVELDSGDRNYPDTRLGHFRLSVSEDSRTGLADELIATVRKYDLESDELLAAASLIHGEARVALNILEHARQRDARIAAERQPEVRHTLIGSLLAATAHQQLGQHDTAKQTVKDALNSIEWKPLPHSLTGFVNSALRDFSGLTPQDVRNLADTQSVERELERLTRAIENSPHDHRKYHARAEYLARLGRWQESAEGFLQQLERVDVNEWRMVMMRGATAQLIAGKHDAYRRLCERAIERFPTANNAQEADVLVKVCLLRPDTVEMSKLPVQMVKESAQPAEVTSIVPWYMACSTLAAYRSGRLDEARALSIKVSISNWNAYYSLAQAVRAMAEAKLGNREAAMHALANCERHIDPQLSTFGRPSQNIAVPVAALSVHHDWLIAELLRREAAILIHNDEARTTPFESVPTAPSRTIEEWAALGEWAEAARSSALKLVSNPRYRVEMSRLAALQLLAGDVENYRHTCQHGLTNFSGKLLTDEAESLTKTCLMGNSKVELSRLPIKQLRDAIDDPQQASDRSYWIAVCSLAAYRAGELEQVLSDSQQQTTLSGSTGGMLLLVRAMAEEKLGRHEQALQSMGEAARVFPQQLPGLGTTNYTGSLPVPDSVIHHDWLIAEVLRREAIQIIPGSSNIFGSEFERAMRRDQLAMLGKWAEAAKVAAADQKNVPQDRGLFAYTAALLMLAGDVEGHRHFCDRALKPFDPVMDAAVAESLCKGSLLSPDAVSPDRLPIKTMRDGFSESYYEPAWVWFRASNTLALYREGKFTEAVSETKKIDSLDGHVGALALVVRAMSEEKLGQHVKALRTLADAEAIIPPELGTLGTDKHKGTAIVPRDTISVDWLIPEVLRREAAALIRK